MGAIAFSYEIATATGQVRLYAGDTDGSRLNESGGDRTRTDAEIAFLLTQNGGDARAAAAELLEGKAAEYAQSASNTTQGHLKQDLTVRSTKCLEAAKALRRNVSGSPVYRASARVFSTTAADGTPGTMDDW